MKSLLFLILLSASGKTCKQGEGIPFIEGTSQRYSGGIAGSASGTYYKIHLKKEAADQNYTFDSLWVNNKRVKVEIKKNESRDTLVLFANDRNIPLRTPDQVQPTPEEIKPVSYPIESKAAGILGYFHNGKRGYYEILMWKQLEPIHYP